MKSLITGFLFLLTATSASANQWTCKAYCLEQTTQDVVLFVENAAYPQRALDEIAKQCAELNYVYSAGDISKVTLFSSAGEHHAEADVFNSCKQADLTL